MYVSIRESTLRPEAQEQYDAAYKEFAAIRAQQPGYRGGVSIDAGDGRRASVTLWEDEEAQAAAVAILGPHSERILQPHWAAPARVVYRGPVVTDDLVAVSVAEVYPPDSP